jgi:hypothetical protein
MALQLTVEESLLLLTCRPYLSATDDVIVERLGTQPMDWAEVLWRAEYFRTIPLITYHLRRLDVLSAVPATERTYLQAWTAVSRARVEALYGELDDILDALDRAAVPYFLLKGVVAGPLLYPDPLLRPMLDIDIMVDPDALDVARDSLEALGYRHGVWDPGTGKIAVVDYGDSDPAEHHELPSYLKTAFVVCPVPPNAIPTTWRRKHLKVHPDGRGGMQLPIFVDVHFNLSVGFDLADVWRGSHVEQVLGRPVKVQSITGMLWFIAARLYNEAFQFGTVKLLMLGDVIALLARRSGDVDWDEIVYVARRYGMQPALYYVFSQARQLGAAVPDRVLGSLQPRSDNPPMLNDWGDLLPKMFSRAFVHDIQLANGQGSGQSRANLPHTEDPLATSGSDG